MHSINIIFNKLYKISLVVLLAIFLLFIFFEIDNLDTKRYLSEHYISEGVQETGSINLVTSVLYDYRSFDTLGEATVLLAATAILSFLVSVKKVPMARPRFTIIINQTVILIIPLLAVLGAYLMLFGHISPGGGFIGGVILAIIIIVVIITYGIEFSEYHFKSDKKSLLEDIGAIGFIVLGLLGIFTGYNFLANGQAYFGIGNPGELFSAGLIPYLNLMIGIKVGAGLAIIFSSLIKEE